MKRKFLHVINWEKYQSRTDKEMPWFKMWSSLFTRDWWQEMEQKNKIFPVIFLETARRFGNKMPQNCSYYTQNYGLKCTEEEWFIICKSLCDIGFLSSVTSDIEDKIRRDKIQIEKEEPKTNDVFNYFLAKYEEKRQTKYIPNYAKDKKLLKDLLLHLEAEPLKILMGAFFDSKDAFVLGSDYSVGVFKSQVNKLQGSRKDDPWKKIPTIPEKKMEILSTK